MLDTGADISIFKANKLTNNVAIDTRYISKISGIGQSVIHSLGKAKSEILTNDVIIKHYFQIVDENFSIPCDGILGLDFIKNNNCILDYRKDHNFLIIRPEHYHDQIEIPIGDSIGPNILSIPARAQAIRKINIDTQDQEIFVPNQKLKDGVFIANTIVTNDQPFVLIVNTTSQDAFIKDFKVKTENLSEYDIIEIASTKEKNRKKKIIAKLSKNFPEFVKEPLTELCKEFNDIFALETDKITVNNFYKQKLRISDDTPVYIKNYRTPHSQKDEIKKQVVKLNSDGVVEPSFSAYNSPVLLVPKKPLPGSSEKRYRLVIDYRQINKKLIADKYPLPRIDDILDQLGRAKYFSCLDLMSGFHQIELTEDSRDITSFSVPNQGSFRFKRLPYGLKVSPNSFQRMMTIAFSGLEPEQAFLYMDDIVVVGCSEQHMLKNLRTVFEICRKFNLKLHPDKCTFFGHEVTFLGHKCTDRGILPDDSKYKTIESYPRPKNADETKRFVAFCNYYRRFIANFAKHALPLTRLTRKNTEFEWSDTCETSFQYLKKSLLSPKILQYPNFNKKFCITTDASKNACGAILSQEYNGAHLPVAYASRAFTKGESNKSVIEQELAAVHWAIKYFRPYVYGKKFLVKSDHRPISYLFSMKNPSSKLTRMRLDLEEYDFEIEFIKGKDNCGADALSRINFEEIKEIRKENRILQVTTRSKSKNTTERKQELTNEKKHIPKCYEALNIKEEKKNVCLKFSLKGKSPRCYLQKGKRILEKMNLSDTIVNGIFVLEQFFPRLESITDNKEITKLQLSLNDEIFEIIKVSNFKNTADKYLKNLVIALTPKLIIVTADEQKKNLLEKFHDDPIFGGHPGITRMTSKLRSKYFWTGMSREIRNYVKKCVHCQKNKTLPKTKEQLFLTETPARAFDVIQVDTIGPIMKSNNGNEYAVTIICDLTKYLVVVPIPDKSAKTVAKAIFEKFILVYGPMKKIISDMGTEYKNQVLQELCALMKIDFVTSTAYHHQTLGTVERSHKTFNEYVRSYISIDKTDWCEYLSYFAYCFNTTPSTVHGYCPYELVFAKIAPTIEVLETGKIDPIYNIDSYQKEIKYRLQVAHDRVTKMLDRAKKTNKIRYDKTVNQIDIQVDDLVLIQDDAGHKLTHLFKGPYKVDSVDNRGNVSITLNNGKSMLVHKNRIRKFLE